MLSRDYLEWLYFMFGDNTAYTISLFETLSNIEYRYQNSLDENRVYGGLQLRSKYAYETGVYEDEVATTACKDSRYYLYVFSLKMPLGLKTKGEFLTESRKLLKSGDTILPFGIIREDDFSAFENTIEYSHEEAMLSGLLDGVEMKRRKYNKSQLQSVKYDFFDNEDRGQLNIEINCIEDIAEERKILTE